MKKITLLIFSSVLLLAIIGCSSNDEDSTTQPDEEPTVETEDKTDESNTNDKDSDDESTDKNTDADSLNFTDFELEVEYTDHKEYEAEYELDNNGNIEAEIEDDLNGTEIKGDEAFEKLEPMLKELNIQQDTPKEDAIKNALDVFDLPNDYTKFELEITFDDNTEIEFEDKK